MARFARAVVPDHPYHVTCRGNWREAVFFTDEDREVYLALLSEYAGLYGLEIWAYCLMMNSVHLVVLPHGKDSLANESRANTHAIRPMAEPAHGLEWTLVGWPVLLYRS